LVDGQTFDYGNIASIALDGDSVYWTASNGQNGVVAKVPKTGGAPVMLAPVVGQAGQIIPIGTDTFLATTVYFSDANGIHQVPLKGGAPTVIAPVSPRYFALEGTERLYWTDATGVWQVSTQGGVPTRILTVATSNGPITVGLDIYWADDTGTLRSKGGEVMSTLASGPATPQGIVIPAASAPPPANPFLVVAYSSALLQVPLPAGGTTVLIPDLAEPQALAAEGSTAYFTEKGSNGGLKKMLIPGGVPVPLAIHGSPADSAGLAVDGTYVYWSMGSSILKTAK
jgi:hypothetical protein